MTMLGTIQEFVILAIAFVIRVANLGGPLLSSYAWMGWENSHPARHPARHPFQRGSFIPVDILNAHCDKLHGACVSEINVEPTIPSVDGKMEDNRISRLYHGHDTSGDVKTQNLYCVLDQCAASIWAVFDFPASLFCIVAWLTVPVLKPLSDGG